MNMVKYMRVTRPESLLNFVLENDANCCLHTIAARVNLHRAPVIAARSRLTFRILTSRGNPVQICKP